MKTACNHRLILLVDIFVLDYSLQRTLVVLSGRETKAPNLAVISVALINLWSSVSFLLPQEPLPLCLRGHHHNSFWGSQLQQYYQQQRIPRRIRFPSLETVVAKDSGVFVAIATFSSMEIFDNSLIYNIFKGCPLYLKIPFCEGEQDRYPERFCLFSQDIFSLKSLTYPWKGCCPTSSLILQ